MTLPDFIRHALLVEGCRQIVLHQDPQGRWQASLLRKTGTSHGVAIHSDPVDALWNVLVPHTMIRRDDQSPEKTVTFPLDVSTVACVNPSSVEIDIDDLLG